MPKLAFESLDEALVGALPELRIAYDRELAWWNGEAPPRHVLYASVLNPALQKALAAPSKHHDFLARAFAFVEQLAGHEDPRVKEVAALTVVESLANEPQLLKEAKRRMGPASLEALSKIQHSQLYQARGSHACRH